MAVVFGLGFDDTGNEQIRALVPYMEDFIISSTCYHSEMNKSGLVQGQKARKPNIDLRSEIVATILDLNISAFQQGTFLFKKTEQAEKFLHS